MLDAVCLQGYEGNHKLPLTQWMLVIFSLGTLGYFILLGINGQSPSDLFFMNFILGRGAIEGAFTVGNFFEHRAKSPGNLREA